MIYVFDDDAGSATLKVRSETYKYLIKVRRHQPGDTVTFRNPSAAEVRHDYTLISFDGRQAHFELASSSDEPVEPLKTLHIGWCVIDPKSIEKMLPSLNEIGVTQITFITSERSQKNFKPDFKRYERILESSMQQCGRTRRMQLTSGPSLSAFLNQYPDAAVFDLCDTPYGGEPIETVIIGPEGGFSDTERTLFKSARLFRLDTPLVLRSETAALAIASKIVL
jgi:16S rRNA (uracil1498-N3)-methyltransferase